MTLTVTPSGPRWLARALSVVVGSVVVGDTDGDTVGSEVVGAAVGSEVVGDTDGDAVGSQVVSEHVIAQHAAAYVRLTLLTPQQRGVGSHGVKDGQYLRSSHCRPATRWGPR